MQVRPSMRRRAASLVEFALVYPVVLMLSVGVVIVAMAVYNYQQVASLAREGARWASVHGGQYNQETGGALATSDNIKTAILSKAVGMDTSELSVTASWTNSNEMP